MTRTILTYVILCIHFSTQLSYTGPGNGLNTKTVESSLGHSSSMFNRIKDGTTTVKIVAYCGHSSCCEIFIPRSVKNIELSGEIGHSAQIILYSYHSPEIISNGMYAGHSSRITVMHPIRQYTYHILGTSAILAAIMMYLHDRK